VKFAGGGGVLLQWIINRMSEYDWIRLAQGRDGGELL
jgi:hypothetical protein